MRAKRDRSKDWDRHYRVAQRLMMRLEGAYNLGNLARVKVLAARIHRVKDIQIRDLGY